MLICYIYIYIYYKYIYIIYTRCVGCEELSAPPKFSMDIPLFSKSSLNVLFSKDVTKNVHENHYSTRVS